MICPKCGEELHEDAKFGKKFSASKIIVRPYRLIPMAW